MLSPTALSNPGLGRLLIIILLLLTACAKPTSPAPLVSSATNSPIPSTATPTVPASLTTPTTSHTHSLLGDLRVRQGIARCTNRQALLRSVYPWLEDAASFEMHSVLPRSHWAYPADSDAFQTYPYDPESGQALFEQAGWRLPPGGSTRVNAAGEQMRLTLTTTTAEFRQTWTKVFQQQMQACGLAIELNYLPAEDFYSENGVLQRRQFELAAISGVNQPEPNVSAMFACDSLPTAANQWQGQNFSGWCNLQAESALRILSSDLHRDVRRQAYLELQAAFSQELPHLPLFNRLAVSAANPNLQNYSPDPLELYTWNAAEWSIPGRDRIVVGYSSEPMGVFPLETDYASKLIQALVYGLDYAKINYDYQPLTLAQLPALENGMATEKIVLVQQGAQIVDANGNPQELQPGVHIRAADGDERLYEGGTVEMRQLIVEYQFLDSLTWSDGASVVRDDYELAHRILCDPQTGAAEYLSPLPACEKIESVQFISDTSYVVTWKPGYYHPEAFLPPFGRLPAHQTLSDGRRLADLPAAEWLSRAELTLSPPGIGPYMVKGWDFGHGVVLEANPYYYKGKQATSRIEIRFVPIESDLPSATMVAQGSLDLMGWYSLPADASTVAALLEAQSQGGVRLYSAPDLMFEQVIFQLQGR